MPLIGIHIKHLLDTRYPAKKIKWQEYEIFGSMFSKQKDNHKINYKYTYQTVVEFDPKVIE